MPPWGPQEGAGNRAWGMENAWPETGCVRERQSGSQEGRKRKGSFPAEMMTPKPES